MASAKEKSPVAENTSNSVNFASSNADLEDKPRNGVDFSSVNGKVSFDFL